MFIISSRILKKQPGNSWEKKLDVGIHGNSLLLAGKRKLLSEALEIESATGKLLPFLQNKFSLFERKKCLLCGHIYKCYTQGKDYRLVDLWMNAIGFPPLPELL